MLENVTSERAHTFELPAMHKDKTPLDEFYRLIFITESEILRRISCIVWK